MRSALQAVAGAFAEGFAVATSDCYAGSCTVNAHALSQAIASVLAIATSQAIAHQCTGAPRDLSLPHVRPATRASGCALQNVQPWQLVMTCAGVRPMHVHSDVFV